MNKRTINIIIILMSIGLFGISVIQFYWLKKGIDLNAKNFDAKVQIALSRVKQQIEDDSADLKLLAEELNMNNTSLFSTRDFTFKKKDKAIGYRDLRRQQQVADMAKFLKPDVALNNISPADLTRYLRIELGEHQDIDLQYDYGIYSYKNEDFIITNGKYNVSLGKTSQSSQGATVKNLERTTYEVDLFNIDGRDAAGSLKVFFPKKTSFLITSILPALLSSIILTGLILFCFIYTINIILTQKKVSQMKTDFINNMTHEFKTPIATISLAADSINNPKVMSKPNLITRYAKIIKEENSRMLVQVEKVLNIARLDKRDFQLKKTNVDINQLIQTVVKLAELKVQERDGKIDIDLRATHAQIQGDENHISNLLHNVLDNADKYSPEQPEIKVETEDAQGGVRVIVTDKGMGMSKEDTKKIFDKFYRVGTGNLHDVKGFGLGLSYVKAIVDAHNGSIAVESQINQGSSFKIFFPHDYTQTK